MSYNKNRIGDNMYDYFDGIIKSINFNNIVIEVNKIGYKIFTPNPYIFKLDEQVKIYLFSYIREDEYSLYGFKDIKEREMFLRLISVKGLGPKVALPVLAGGSLDGIEFAINKENYLYFTKFPKIGDKLARQIILDLKGKTEKVGKVVINDELIMALESLGYKNADIRRIIKDIDFNHSIEEQIKEALKLLLK